MLFKSLDGSQGNSEGLEKGPIVSVDRDDMGPSGSEDRLYECELCQAQFIDPLAYGRHLRSCRKKHGVKSDLGAEGPSKALDSDPRLEEAEDLRHENKVLELERVRLDRLNKIRKMDPSFGRVPSEESSSSTTAKIADLEVARYIRALTEEENEKRHLPILSTPLADPRVQQLSDKVEMLTRQLQDERFQSLKSSFEMSINALRNEVKSNENELKTLITEASSLAKLWISSPGPATQIIASKFGMRAVVLDDPPTALAPEETRDGIVVGLRQHGYVAQVIEKETS